ncbi:NfeD family protein [Sodalis glossinidius]|uniref:NfeD family protein n=1 Tax=Sodalis glossinidius TaxID=63612 RepID=UPI003C774D32
MRVNPVGARDDVDGDSGTSAQCLADSGRPAAGAGNAGRKRVSAVERYCRAAGRAGADWLGVAGGDLCRAYRFGLAVVVSPARQRSRASGIGVESARTAAIELRTRLSEPLSNGFGRLRVGDSTWRIQASEDLPAVTWVEVYATEGITLRVRRALPE